MSSGYSSYPPMPRLSDSSHIDGDPYGIDTSSLDDTRPSFRNTEYDSALPLLRQRFPNIAPLYLTKIFRGTITAPGLVWLDVDREDASPSDFPDLPHLLYCFEVYGQIICILADPKGNRGLEVELQRALTDYRIRLLKLAKGATFESLNEWHKAFLEEMFQKGQDRPEGWRERREGLTGLLRRKG